MVVGVAGFCQARVEEAMTAAQEAFKAAQDGCIQCIIGVWESYIKERCPSLPRPLTLESLSTEAARVQQKRIVERRWAVIKELSVGDLQSRMEALSSDREWPVKFVRSQLKAAREEFERPVSTEELFRAYVAGPPPDISDLTGQMAASSLDDSQCAPMDDGVRERQCAQRMLAHFERQLQLSRANQVIIEQSRLWMDTGAGDSNGLPPLRPGGRVRLNGRFRRVRDGSVGELVQWLEDKGRWWVRAPNCEDADEDGEEWDSDPDEWEGVTVQPEHLVALPDSEPWFDGNERRISCYASAFGRYVWALRHPLQAQALGTRFDAESGKPIWFEEPPAHVLETLPSGQLSKVFSGSLTQHIEALREQARPHASDPSYDPLGYMQHKSSSGAAAGPAGASSSMDAGVADADDESDGESDESLGESYVGDAACEDDVCADDQYPC